MNGPQIMPQMTLQMLSAHLKSTFALQMTPKFLEMFAPNLNK